MAILFVPGFMLDRDLWSDVEPALDRFGPAGYADLTQDDTLSAFAARALAQAPPSFVLVGFSMGGYVAREIWRQSPERVSALVLIATSARGSSDTQARRKAANAGLAGKSAFRGLSTAAVASALHPDHRGDTGLIARIQAMGTHLGGEVFGRQSMLERPDERERLHTIHCPTLVIAGEADQLRSREETLELHDGITGSAFEVIAGTGHMIPLEAPQRLADVIAAWLDGLPSVQVR